MFSDELGGRGKRITETERSKPASRKSLLRFLREENGATMVEYALLVALLSVALVAVLSDMGGNIVNTFSNADKGFD